MRRPREKLNGSKECPRGMRGMSFDTKKFIKEVEKKGVLWKAPSNGQAKIQDFKQKAWEEIGEIMFDNWNNSNQITKEARIREMKLLWKNITAKFFYDFKRGLLEGKKGRKYKDILAFLLLAGGDRQVELTTKNKDQTEKMRQEKTKDSPVKKTKVIKKKSVKATGLIPVVSTPEELEDEEDIDEDASFFKAMLPVTKKFNDQQRLDFRLYVLQAVKKVREQPGPLKITSEKVAVRKH